MNIKIIGSLSGEILMDEQIIQKLFNTDIIVLSHYGEFSGKPTTRIYANDKWVLKVSRNCGFPSQSVASKWCQLQIKKEQEYNIYHPQRTWLLFGDQKRWAVANITPRVLGLHRVNFQALESNARIQLLGNVLNIYINFTTRFGLRLDEGLSNFCLADKQVYYLDDDIYPWDNFFSFSAMLGNFLRKSEILAMNTKTWAQLGTALQPLLRSHSSDAEDIVRENIIDQIVGREEASKIAFLTALRPTYKVTMSQQASGDFNPSEPIAILADVHANLPAFQTIMNELESYGVQQYLILGDIVGYGPNPKECIDLIQQKGMFCIRGNHDHYVAYNGDVRVAMGKTAKWTADWTLNQLHDDDKMWLGALPVRHQMKEWMAVHGSPVDKSFFNGYVYNMTSERNLNHLKEINMPICLHGHSHIQGVYSLSKGNYSELDTRLGDIALQDNDASLICPGSVGQPRGNEKTIIAEAAIYYPDQANVKMIAVPYDISPVIADMESQGFPEQIIKRLREVKHLNSQAVITPA